MDEKNEEELDTEHGGPATPRQSEQAQVDTSQTAEIKALRSEVDRLTERLKALEYDVINLSGAVARR